MAKIKPLALSVIGGLSIFTTTYILFWVLLLCLDSPNAAKEAVNVLGSYFGGLATLWAAIVAAYLFNDWRDQHNKVTEKELNLDLVSEYLAIKRRVLELTVEIENFNESRTQKKYCVRKVSHQDILHAVSTLDFDINMFLTKYKLYYTHYIKNVDNDAINAITQIMKTILQIDKADTAQLKIELITGRLKQDIVEFIGYFDDKTTASLINELKIDTQSALK